MHASCCCAHVIVSMLSAMISRVCREKRIPAHVSLAAKPGENTITFATHGDTVRDANGVVSPC